MINWTNTQTSDNYSSKGDQIKFLQNGRWYKMDYLGYEGLAEVVTTNVLRKSNLESFVEYKEEQFINDGLTTLGCSSENFKPDNVDILTALHNLKIGRFPNR